MLLMIGRCIVMMTVMMRGGMMHRMLRQRSGRGALDILNERYARGEINKADYDELLPDCVLRNHQRVLIMAIIR
jgi:uncharacterized membrane protein